MNDSSNDVQIDYVGNDTIAQVTTTSSSSNVEITTAESDRVNDSAECHTIYKYAVTIGEHKGDVRYISFLKDNDKNRYIMVSSYNYNLTCMKLDTFKIV